ncbi:MAG: hypothetical protein IIX61_07875, partial [Loktanella sp.]|nr:hypothetical protein [Loktanella sp.]
MIYPLSGLLFGAVLGAWRARRHGGKTADMVQWAVAFAIILGILGLFLLREGAAFGIMPYGTQALHIMPAEKG